MHKKVQAQQVLHKSSEHILKTNLSWLYMTITQQRRNIFQTKPL